MFHQMTNILRLHRLCLIVFLELLMLVLTLKQFEPQLANEYFFSCNARFDTGITGYFFITRKEATYNKGNPQKLDYLQSISIWKCFVKMLNRREQMKKPKQNVKEKITKQIERRAKEQQSYEETCC